MSLVYDMEGEPRYYGLYYGFVTSNKDPEGLARVRVTIPGLIEPESAWAIPMAMGGGSPQSGGWDVPKVGAAIGVMFHAGDIDEPIYFLGWYGRGETPTPAKEAGIEDAVDKIKCFESDRHLVVLDGRSGSESVVIKDKETGNVISMTKDTIFLGDTGLKNAAGADGVVLGSGIDSFTGSTYGVLGSSSKAVLAKK